MVMDAIRINLSEDKSVVSEIKLQGCCSNLKRKGKPADMNINWHLLMSDTVLSTSHTLPYLNILTTLLCYSLLIHNELKLRNVI